MVLLSNFSLSPKCMKMGNQTGFVIQKLWWSNSRISFLVDCEPRFFKHFQCTVFWHFSQPKQISNHDQNMKKSTNFKRMLVLELGFVHVYCLFMGKTIHILLTGVIGCTDKQQISTWQRHQTWIIPISTLQTNKSIGYRIQALEREGVNCMWYYQNVQHLLIFCNTVRFMCYKLWN